MYLKMEKFRFAEYLKTEVRSHFRYFLALICDVKIRKFLSAGKRPLAYDGTNKYTTREVPGV